MERLIVGDATIVSSGGTVAIIVGEATDGEGSTVKSLLDSVVGVDGRGDIPETEVEDGGVVVLAEEELWQPTTSKRMPVIRIVK